MRAPPAVAVSSVDDLPWRAAHAVLWALAAGCLTAWLVQRLAATSTMAIPLLLLAGLLAAALGWRLARQPASQLIWTGAQWQWLVAGSQQVMVLSAAPDVMLDFGPWLLLRLRLDADGTSRWLTARPCGDLPSWTAFRAAVYSPASGPLGQTLTDLPRS